MNTGLDGRVALVCGASAGIGYAIARALAAEGAALAVVSRSRERIGEAAARIAAETGARVVPLAGDLTDPETPAELVRRTGDALGPVDVLVSNTGGPQSMRAVDAGDDDLDAACRALLLPVRRLVAAVLPGMRERRWGRIVAVTSIAVREPQPGLVLSNAARAALTGYLKTLATEVAADGVTINTVLPGYTATERLRELAEATAGPDGDPGAVLASWAEGNPLGRLLEPAEVGAAVAFLVSESASGITGVALPVDGGRSHGLL